MPRFRVELSTIATETYEVTADDGLSAMLLAQKAVKDGPLGTNMRITRLPISYTSRTETTMIFTPPREPRVGD